MNKNKRPGTPVEGEPSLKQNWGTNSSCPYNRKFDKSILKKIASTEHDGVGLCGELVAKLAQRLVSHLDDETIPEATDVVGANCG